MTHYNSHEFDIQNIGVETAVEEGYIKPFINVALAEFTNTELSDVYEVTNEDAQTLSYPKTKADYFKCALPKVMQFGWLKPSMVSKSTFTYHVNQYEKVIHKHFHRVLVDPNVVNKVRWLVPALNEPYHRLAVYDNGIYNSFADNICAAYNLMEANEVKPNMLVYSQADYDKWSGDVNFLLEYELKYFVDPDTTVSYLTV
jgi:hypothetical protein